MTTFYQPVQRRRDGRWDMTKSTGSTGPTPIGYCAGWVEENPWRREDPGGFFDEALRRRMAKSWDEERAKLLPNQDWFHQDGHATAEEAGECWRVFLVDTRLKFHQDPQAQLRCVVCESWTQGRASVRGPISPAPIALCRDHQTKDHAAEHLFGSCGTASGA